MKPPYSATNLLEYNNSNPNHLCSGTTSAQQQQQQHSFTESNTDDSHNDISGSSSSNTTVPMQEKNTNTTTTTPTVNNNNNNSSSSSHGITYSLQHTLPLLPIPDLEVTLQRYEQRLEALLLQQQQQEQEEEEEEEQQQTNTTTKTTTELKEKKSKYQQQQIQLQNDIQDFLQNEGPILYQELCEYEQNGRQSGQIGSYVEEFWYEAYLKPDTSIVLNLNPYFVLEPSPDPKMVHNNPITTAASLCYAALKMVSMIRNHTLVPDTFHHQPLCMHQFHSLFGSSRQPINKTTTTTTTANATTTMDDVHVYNDSTHVVVMYQNQFYYFHGLWSDTYAVAVNESDIRDILYAIQTHANNQQQEQDDEEPQLSSSSSSNSSGTGLGVFTTLPRSQWAKVRHQICKGDVVNETSFKIIDSALFVLVLDDYIPTNVHETAANMLHGMNIVIHKEQNNKDNGDGSTRNENTRSHHHNHYKQMGTCLNRWYDKLQLIVCKDGTTGLVFEHSIIDGHTALRFVSDMYSETIISFAESIVDLIHGRGTITHVVNAVVDRAIVVNRKSPVIPKDNTSSSERYLDVRPKKLLFNLSDSIIRQIQYAEAALCDEIHSTDTYILEYKKFGKRLIVTNNMSPDAFVQMSILLSYYMLYGKVECMYEPALTKQFFHGRTEAIRGTTIQAKSFCEVYCNPNSTKDEKVAALRIATTEHTRLTKEAAAGQGVDRLLFALKCIASRNGHPEPKFFQSEGWNILNNTILSTSNCGNPALRLFGFGPVVPNGFGIGYIIKDDGISYSVCSKRRQTSRYVQTLEHILDDFQRMLQPISSVSVDQPEDNKILKPNEATIKPAESSSYDDIWGENESIFILPPKKESIESTESRLHPRSSQLYSSRVHEHSIRGDLLSVSAIDIVPDDDKRK